MSGQRYHHGGYNIILYTRMRMIVLLTFIIFGLSLAFVPTSTISPRRASIITTSSSLTAKQQQQHLQHNMNNDDDNKFRMNKRRWNAMLDSSNRDGWKGLCNGMLSLCMAMWVWAMPWPTVVTTNRGFVVNGNEVKAMMMNENQQSVNDVWFAITAQFFDPTFNGLGEDGWRAKKMEAMQAVVDAGPDDEELVTQTIRTMILSLQDPYTRYLTKDQLDALTAYARGSSSEQGGIGVQLLLDPRSQNILIMGLVPNGPAANSHIIQTGDTILKIDGQSVEGATAETVAAKLRGNIGDSLTLLIQHHPPLENAKKEKEEVTLTRSSIQPNKPVQVSTFVSSNSGKTIGLFTIPSFTTETVQQVLNGMRSFTTNNGEGSTAAVEAVVLDVRGNVGGYMPAGVDLAKLFLPARAHIIAEVNKGGNIVAYDADGIGANTQIPLYVLVDQRTASASEIAAAALQDNKRATIIGASPHTFGKGRIQNVQTLQSGNGVAVTRARYVTPSGRDIHGIGITPNILLDNQCTTSSQSQSPQPVSICLSSLL